MLIKVTCLELKLPGLASRPNAGTAFLSEQHFAEIFRVTMDA